MRDFSLVGCYGRDSQRDFANQLKAGGVFPIGNGRGQRWSGQQVAAYLDRQFEDAAEAQDRPGNPTAMDK